MHFARPVRGCCLALVAFVAMTAANSAERAIDKEIVVPAPIETVWQTWTSRDGIRSFFAPDAAQHLFVRATRAVESAVLSPRECQVLQLIAEGRSTKEIATQLRITSKTIENHRTNMRGKLGLHSIAELTRYAVRHGMIEL